jgi:DNA-binding transcriptional MerR regulator
MTYTNAQVEKLLGVKGSALRYWEKEVPLIQPARDIHGRFLYSERDIEMLLRLKHLLYDRHFSIENARSRLLEETSGASQDIKAIFSEIRSDLIKLFFINKESGT